MYLDRVKISIKAGDGGDGCATFFRDKMTMKGGPDGGDGGRGGNVVFKATTNMTTLQSFQFKKKFVATNGGNGQKRNKTGANGQDIVIEVPVGTVILDATTNKIIADLTQDGQTWLALRGGDGGRGNAFFATSVRQSPRFSQTGEKTKEKQVILELKTIADVGVIGYPNVGKSTLLSVLSNAKPKIADYQFTTLYPNLGVVNVFDNTFVMADIPGLIEGASEGYGLGHHFLKHVERVRMLVHLVDISESEHRSAVKDYEIINQELKKYSEKLAKLPQLVVLSKADLLSQEELEKRQKEFEKQTGVKTLAISSVIHKNTQVLKEQIWNMLKNIPKPTPLEIEQLEFDIRDKSSVNIEKVDQHTYRVSGGYIDNLIRGVVLSDFVSFAYFQKRLQLDGIIEKLQEAGMQHGDTVLIKDISFTYEI
jgi:GTP-binding protein